MFVPSSIRAFYPPRKLTTGFTLVARRAAIADATQTMGVVPSVTKRTVTGSAGETP
jgi:hypothetical protein